MIFSFKVITAYILGGFTLFPAIFILCYIVYLLNHRIISPLCRLLQTQNHSLPEEELFLLETEETPTNNSALLYKVGWLKVSQDEEKSLPDASIGNMVKNYISGKAGRKENANVFFAVLKYNTLYLYDSEKQLDCRGVIHMTHYAVYTHPPGLQDYELFSKPNLIKLEATMDEKSSSYYINCHKCIDKEDWYFALIRASRSTLPAGEHIKQDKTHFDQSAMNHLITMVHSDEHHFQTQWLNAILGRIFFGVYRTQEINDALYKKVITKLDKINAKRPPFLGEITVRSVDPGHALPRFTQPKLLGLSPTGELSAEAHLQYDGGFRIEIETVLKWKYSDRLKPLTIDLVLGITLKEIQGKILIKIKEPPTNRFWYAFYECPKMEWKVEPVVWEKRVGYSVVVKAIETKIQEFIMETMVLPNFDDITFFPTNGVGGIFEIPPSLASTVMDAFQLTNDPVVPVELVLDKESIEEFEPKQDKKAKAKRFQEDEALLTTAKSLPELFSAVPRQQEELYQQLKTSPILIPANDAKTKDLLPASLSTSPDSLLSSSPSSVTIEDSLRTISHVLTDESASVIMPSASHSLTTCDSIKITGESIVDQGNNKTRLRKSSSLALLKPKTGASTAVNVSPAMAHKTQQQSEKKLDAVSVI
ncbi:putative integral membrane protein conserved region-domain-containing protein [Gilbertella persicaria]|uniref:putative integral membrane protein conserved region-domain-containing protein n=1 Tax=Gilbertella persicaria TaxID=101096 RepID=UPI00221E6132|nr:putative integral membrane protein conserved region-domain-containing protein [Gilbertella persicaria]KAI8083343.1 putative integral membrane protein conserved region-domain-containing protein [Gilbertella persicaria]